MRTAKSKPLSFFRHANRFTIADLEGMKSIMEVTTPRKLEYWLVLPAVGDADARCILIKKAPKWELRHVLIIQTLSDYLPRITKLHFTGELATEINRKIEKIEKDKSDPCPLCQKPFKTCGHF